jgi:Type II secretion system (T2SS), protein E, N-terminal domain
MSFLTKNDDPADIDAVMYTAAIRHSLQPWEGIKSSGALGRNNSDLLQTQQRRLCGSIECASTWTMPWRNRRRPVFEGQWGCSGRCVLAMVHSSMRRTTGDSSSLLREAPHRHRIPLGLLMLAQGWITHPQLQYALSMQRENGSGRIGEWLIRECGLSTEQVTRGLSLQWGCPMLTTDGLSPETMALVMPRMFIERFGLLPLRVAGSHILYLGFADRADASVSLAAEQMTGLKIETGVVEGATFETAKRRLLACNAIDAKLQAVEDKDALAARITAALEQCQPVASRLVRVHEYYWLRLWLENGAFGAAGSLPGSAEDIKDYIFTVGVGR